MTNLPGAGLWPLKDWKVNLSTLPGDVVHPHEDFWCMGDDYPFQVCEDAVLLISDALRGISLRGPMKYSQWPSVPQHHIMFTMDLFDGLTS
eukprot:8563299-Karenia_brevis.AAC.1